jgi:drug/metabolite transporter (DMT)-like permease
VASLALGVMWLASGDSWPPRAAWPGILGSGVLWFGLYMITLNWGEREVDAGTAAMVVTIGPILKALLGGWLFREGFPRRLGAGMAVSLAGAIVVGIAESGGGRTSIIGVVLWVAAAVCYAAGVVFQKPALGHASAVQVTTFGCFTGTTTKLLSYFRSMSLPASRRRWFVSFILPASPHRHDPRDGITDQCKYAGRRTSGAICG